MFFSVSFLTNGTLNIITSKPYFYTDERHCEVKVRPETVLQGDGYAVSVCDKDHRLRFQAQDPEPFLRKLDQSVFRSIMGLRHSRVHPLFLVKVTDCKADADLKELKMQLSIFKKNDFSLKYIVLQQDISTMVWRDITNMSTVGKGIILFLPSVLLDTN